MLTSRFSVLLSTSVPLLLTPTGWTFQCDVGRRLTPIHRRSQRLITLFVFNRPHDRIRPNRYISCCSATRRRSSTGVKLVFSIGKGLHPLQAVALHDQITIENCAGFWDASVNEKRSSAPLHARSIQANRTRIWRPIPFVWNAENAAFQAIFRHLRSLHDLSDTEPRVKYGSA
jgi:hypothetical protein